MLARIDPIGKIQQLYLDDRPVPYMTFLKVYNDLLEDVTEAVPREPSDELREKFRAACMAVNVGLIDTEGRGEERTEEFRQKVLPLWKERLAADQFARYQEILDGEYRRRRRAASEEQEEPQEEAIGSVAAGATESSDLLRRLGLLEGEPAEQPREQAPAETAEIPLDLEAELAAAVGLPFENVEQLCAAIRDGSLEVSPATPQEDEEFASYMLRNREIGVKLARTDGRSYVVLTAPFGYSGVPEAEEEVDVFAAEMKYVRMADFAYMREDREFVYTLRLRPDRTSLACAPQAEGEEESVVRRVQKLHWDLAELAERLGV